MEAEILAEEVEDLSAKIEALEKQAKDDEQVIKEVGTDKFCISVSTLCN